MSTYIGVRCHTDGAQTGCGVNHHYEAMVALIRGAEILKQAITLPVDIKPEFYFDDDWGDPSLLSFIIEHCGHDMRLYDEYGYDYDANGEREERA